MTWAVTPSTPLRGLLIPKFWVRGQNGGLDQKYNLPDNAGFESSVPQCRVEIMVLFNLNARKRVYVCMCYCGFVLLIYQETLEL